MSIKNLLAAAVTSGSGGGTVNPVLDIFGDSSCVAYYPMDGNANDISGNYHGAETSVTYGGGAYDRGAVFNGSSTSRVTTTAFPFTGTSNISISMWINTPTLSNKFLCNFGMSSTDRNWILLKADGKVQVGGWYGSYSIVDTTNAVYSANTWSHIVYTYNGTTRLVYINGALVPVITGSAVLSGDTPSGVLTLGDSNITNGPYNGSMDQVRIFNRAITQTEVTALYQESKHTSTVNDINPFLDNSCKTLYKFEGDATDATGVYNGTATNVTYGTGKFGQCAVFNGSANIKMDTALTTLLLNNSFSLSMWFKTGSDVSTWQILFEANESHNVDLAITGGKLQVYVYNGAVNYINSVQTLTADTWYHAVWTYSEVTFLSRLYINGIVETGTITANTSTNVLQSTTFGSSASSNVRYFNGSMDQVRIFNKVLTPMEVAGLYNETTPTEFPMAYQPDPFKDTSGKALWRLEGNALDESGYYNGTTTAVTYGTGISGRCGVFNGGSSSYMATGILNGNTLTYSFWLKATSTVNQGIISDCDATGSSTTTNLQVYCYNGNLMLDRLGSGTTIGAFSTYATGIFNHFVFSVSSSDVKAYINGTLVHTWVKASGTPTTSPVTIGRLGLATVWYLTGSLDQVRVFNRALTQAEVTLLYNNQA